MNLKQFARLSGVKIIACDPKEWGGAFAYKAKDSPNCTTCGFKSEEEAYKGWLNNHFQKYHAKAILKLLKETEIKGIKS